MPESLIGLVTGDELQKVHALKSKKYDEKTVAAATREALALKVAGEQADGWEILRENARSTRLAKQKPADRQLEDDVWCLLFRMGFKELNEGRQFVVQTGPTAPPRQLDVFARDAETALVVECTHSRDAGPKSVKNVIDKICGFREEVIHAVHRQYGRDPKLKVKFAIATRNIEWRKADRDRANDARIAIIDDDDLRYFSTLTALLKHAARFQFLGRYFKGEKVEGLRTKVPATRGHMGNASFYSFLISPHDLLRIAYISHRSSNDDLETYQRMVQSARLKAIGAYIDDGGKFPTNIVVNLKVDGKLNFDIKESFGDTATGILTLPGNYGSAWIIDGQHRLYGYAHATRGAEEERSVVTVLAFENLPLKEEIGLFVDINTQQVKVSRRLVDEIISSLNIEDPDPRKRLDAMLARTALSLNTAKKSPVAGRILTVARDKSQTRCLTLTSIADGIGDQAFLGTVHRPSKTIIPGRLSVSSGDPKESMQKAVDAICGFLNIFATELDEHWALGDAKGGYLCTNNGIRALLQMFRRLIAYVEQADGLRAESLSAEDIVERVAPYLTPVVAFFKAADPETIGYFRARGSSLQSVSQNCFQMLSVINEARPDFLPADVAEYMNSRDIEGTNKAKDMIDEMNKIIYDDVLERLQSKFGLSKDAWWVQGVPKSIRIDCDIRFNNEAQGDRQRWQFLTFSNYSDIIVHGDNWELFKDHYNFLGKGKKALLPRWLGHLNKVRNITHHVEKGPLTKDEVAFVKQVHALVKTHIEGGERLIPNKRYLHDQGQQPSDPSHPGGDFSEAAE